MFSQLQIYGAAKGLKNTNKSVYGIVDGIYVSLEIVNQAIVIRLPIVSVPQTAIKKIENHGKKQILPYD